MPILPSESPCAPPLRQLQVQGLQLGYTDWNLCRDWTHTWAPGLHLVLGGDGAGKSSLLRVLAGAQAPVAGQVHWSGQPVSGNSVFWVDPRQPALQGANQGTPQQWIAQLLQRYPGWDAVQWHTHVEQWQLQAALSKPWHALSTGTARKLWMAAGLASGAPLVLVDEPIAGLDRPSVTYLREALRQRAGQEAQWLVVAHYDDLQGLPWDSVLELEALPQQA